MSRMREQLGTVAKPVTNLALLLLTGPDISFGPLSLYHPR